MFPLEPLKEELELLYERQLLLYRTQVAESKLDELNAIWGRLEELKEDERYEPHAAAHTAQRAAFALTRALGRLAAMKRFKQTCLADSSK